MISAAAPNALSHPHASQCSMTRKGREKNKQKKHKERTLAKEPEGELKQPEEKGISEVGHWFNKNKKGRTITSYKILCN